MTGVNFIQNALYLAVYLIFVCLIGVLFYGVKKYKQEKRLGSIFVTALVSIFLFFLLNQAAVVCLYSQSLLSIGNYNNSAGINCSLWAARLAIFPEQKSALYGELGKNYMILQEGKKAIEYFDKAYKINGSYAYSDNFSILVSWPFFAGILYLLNGDYDKVYEIAKDTNSYGMAVTASIMQKDYKKALAYSNMNIRRSPIAINYSSRSYIHKKLNQDKLAEGDLQKAVSLCKCNTRCVALQKERTKDSYWLSYAANKKKKYGFAK